MSDPRPRSEEEKMLAGELYSCSDPHLSQLRRVSTSLCNQYNRSTHDANSPEQRQVLEQLFGSMGKEVFIMPPFRCDYGRNTYIGSKTFMNFNTVILDTCRIDIGSNVLFGPNVSLFSARHPLDPAIRRDWGPEDGRPIRIGDDVWVGGNVTILPGVTVGNGSTVGAGSVVTKDVEPYTVVAGNPAKLIKRLPKPEARFQSP
ncbi:Maltose acetyltransferase [Thoreauomyces humboldtii]|nr:Maltose acetyltransferase [Thoreauomyces humboldtii]